MSGLPPPAPGCASCAARDAEIAALRAQLAELGERVARMERAASRNSGNSSMPPSSDDLPGRRPPRKQRRAAERADKRRRGKQPGAPGSAMCWAEPDETRDYYPQGTCACGAGLESALVPPPVVARGTEEVAAFAADHPGQRTVVIPKPAERTQRRRAPGRHRSMRFVPKARRATSAALAMAAAVLAAGCAGGMPASGPASAHPVAATSSRGAGTARAVPPVFAASLASAKPGRGLGDRLALLSSRTGGLLRWLTPQPQGATDGVLSVHDGWVYFVRYPINLRSPSGSAGPAIWRVRVTGGRAQLVQAGASDYAVSPDGRAVAYVMSADHGDVVQVVARNLVSGGRNTIIMATKPSPDANNWPPGVFVLTWAPDDVHLAVQFQLTAAINSVLVFDAFTATTIRYGRAAPAPCPVADYSACGEVDPGYLADGALSYMIQQVSRSGFSASAILVAWQAGHLRTLLSLPGGASQIYDMTAQGQAIWADTSPKQSWTIWRWSGGAPVEVTTLPPYYGVGAIAW